MSDPSFEKMLVTRLNAAIQKIESAPLPEGSEIYISRLLGTIEAALENMVAMSVLVTLSTEGVVLDGIMDTLEYPGALFEMSGRLHSWATRIGMAADNVEGDLDEDDEDHTGHGCDLDPTVLTMNPDKKHQSN